MDYDDKDINLEEKWNKLKASAYATAVENQIKNTKIGLMRMMPI